MKAKLILTATIAALFALGLTATAVAETFESAADGAWNSSGSWTCPVLPCAHDFPVDGDTATIQATHNIYVNSSGMQVDSLTIEQHASDPGILDIRASGVLQIDDGLTMQATSGEPAEIQFSASSGSAGVLKIANDLNAAGPIRVTGSQGGFITSDDSGDTLTLQNTLYVTSGPITITAAFDLDESNDGRLLVDGPYALTVNTNGPIANTTGRFVVAHEDGSMVFNAGTGVTWSTGPAGPYFNIQAGEMIFNDSFGTEAALRMQDGASLTVAASKTFTADEVWAD